MIAKIALLSAFLHLIIALFQLALAFGASWGVGNINGRYKNI